MRELDLTSTYIQAVGYVRDGVMRCSSMGEIALDLGRPTFRTPRGITIYPVVFGKPMPFDQLLKKAGVSSLPSP